MSRSLSGLNSKFAREARRVESKTCNQKHGEMSSLRKSFVCQITLISSPAAWTTNTIDFHYLETVEKTLRSDVKSGCA